MKKLLVLILALALVFSLSFSALAGDKGNGNNKNAEEIVAEDTDDGTGDELSKGQAKKEENALKKAFKAELNAEKKVLQQQKTELEAQLATLMADYDALVAAGDSEGAEALLATITEIQDQLSALQAQIKQAINERYMIIKTMYTAEELAQFDSAAALIEQMYADASLLGAGSITVKDNIIKLEAPAYIKGGKTIIPVRTITEVLGAEVTWDEDTQTVTVVKDNTTVVFGINSTTVYVDGVETELDVAPEITCGRTYVPLRFLAETFGLDVTWDGENEIIDIDDGTGDDGTGDGTDDGSGDGTEV